MDKKYVLLYFLFLLWTAQAQEPLVTDRPDAAESALTVGPDTFQLETGVTSTREGGITQISLPTLLRFGLGKSWEFRVESDTLAFQNPGVNSFRDVSLGVKTNLLTSEDTNVGLLVGLNVPVGNGDLKGTVDPSLALLLDQSLVGELGLGLNVGVTISGDSGARFVQYSWATSLSHPVSQDLTAYLEFYGEGPDRIGGTTQTVADGGLTYLVNRDTQLDLFYAKGLTSQGIDWSIGLGLSKRY